MNESREPGLIRIGPPQRWGELNLRELWQYRELVWVFTVRDIKVYYHQTVLGCSWALLQPLLTMVVFTFIFGRWAKIPSEGFPYPVFVYSALLPWMLFTNCVSSAATSVVNSANLVTKVYFPRLIIPVSAAGSKLIDFALSFLVYLALVAAYGLPLHAGMLWIPVFLVCTILTSLGVGVFLSALIVQYRDFRYVVPFLMQVWMYATPVIFPLSMIDPKWHWLLQLNPMTGVIEGFRAACLGKPIEWAAVAWPVAASLLLFWGAAVVFQKMSRLFADVI